MTVPIALKYAMRSLFRHRRRAVLSILGIGVGCAVCLLLISFVRGEGEMMMRAAAHSGAGHLQLVPAGWRDTRDTRLRLDGWETALATAREVENVSLATPHARTDALLAMGTRTAGVLMTGVDPDVEPRLNRLVRTVHEGRYLTNGIPGEIVIGKSVARRLDVAVGDELVVTASGKGGEIGSAMLRVCGVASTGSRELDAGLCHVLLEDIARMTRFEGAAEITMLLDKPRQIEETRKRLAAVAPAGTEVITWEVIIPELASGVKIDETFTNMMVGVVIVVVFLGIASAQLAAVLERRKEFAVLSAVGMQGSRLVRVMVTEGLILGTAGAVAALTVGTPLVYLMSVKGIDFSAMYGDMDLGISNVLMDPVIYGNFDWWLAPMAFVLALGATMLSSVYPAWFARRTDPAEALRVDR